MSPFWKRLVGLGAAKVPPPADAEDLADLHRAYLKQRRRWDFIVAFCALLTAVTAVLRPLVAVLPLAVTLFAVLEYRKCNRIARTVWDAEALRRWVIRLQAEAREEERQRELEQQRLSEKKEGM